MTDTTLVTTAQSLPPAAMKPADAAAYVAVPVGTLANWRSEGRTDPAYVKVGAKIVYLVADLDAWLLANRVGGGRR